MQVGGEGVGDSLLGTGGDLDGVFLGGEVAHNLGLAIGLLEQRAADDVHTNGLGLVVGDGQTSFGSMTVDELDTKDL